MSIAKIISILEDPDCIYKTSDNNKDVYYEKIIGSSNYRVVITDYKKHVKNVVTAYELKNNVEFDIKHSVSIYDKYSYNPGEQLKRGQEDDLEFFLDLFKVDAD